MGREWLFNDLYNIGGRIKEIDPALSITFDQRVSKYRVARGRHQVMMLDLNELDERVLFRLRKHDLHRRRLEDYIYELEQSELEHERRRARELSNQIESISLENFDQVAGIPHFSVGGVG